MFEVICYHVRMVRSKPRKHYTVTLIVSPSEHSELESFRQKNIGRITLGRLYADGVLAKIREVERDDALIAAGRTQIDPALVREAAR